VRVERTPAADSEVGAGMYSEVAPKSVELPSKYLGAFYVGTSAALLMIINK